MKRIQTPGGSHIEPPFDEAWSELDKLHWHAGVASMDTGLSISVNAINDAPTPYGITVGSSSAAPFSFASAWTYLNGVDTGATERKRVTA